MTAAAAFHDLAKDARLSFDAGGDLLPNALLVGNDWRCHWESICAENNIHRSATGRWIFMEMEVLFVSEDGLRAAFVSQPVTP